MIFFNTEQDFRAVFQPTLEVKVGESCHAGEFILDQRWMHDEKLTLKEITQAVDTFFTENGFRLAFDSRTVHYYGMEPFKIEKSLGARPSIYVKEERKFFKKRVTAIALVRHNECVDYNLEIPDKAVKYKSIELATIDSTLMVKLRAKINKYIHVEVPYQPAKAERRAKISLLCADPTGNLHVTDHYLAPRFIKPFYYAEHVVQDLTSLFSTNSSGLVFLPGDAGTGKTSLIRWLTTEVSGKRFIYVPHNQLQYLSSAGTMHAIMQHFQNSVVILEDAEGLFKTRDGVTTDGLSSLLLNLTDGLLGEIVNCKVVVTQNIVRDIDPAFLRSGRLLYTHNFTALPIEQAKQVARDIGKKEEEITAIDKPMVLADIFAIGGVDLSKDDVYNTTTSSDLESEGEFEEVGKSMRKLRGLLLDE
jgi:hypothetical protein